MKEKHTPMSVLFSKDKEEIIQTGVSLSRDYRYNEFLSFVDASKRPDTSLKRHEEPAVGTARRAGILSLPFSQKLRHTKSEGKKKKMDTTSLWVAPTEA